MLKELEQIIGKMEEGSLDPETQKKAAKHLKDFLRIYKKRIYPEDNEQWARNIAELFNNFDSGSVCEKKAQALMMEHRTLQQSFMRFVVAFIKTKAEERYYDLRDEATHFLCKKLNKFMTEDDKSLPLI